MRILNVGDFNWMTGRERDTANVDLFAIRQKLSRAAIRAGHMVVEFSDRAVARTASPLGFRRFGRQAANRAFLNLVDEVRPDLILLNFADEVDVASLIEARRLSPGVTIVDVNIDPLPDPKTRTRLARLAGQVDAVFLTTAGEALAGLAGPGGFAAFMPNPVDAAVETGRAFETPEPSVDLVLPVGDDSPRQLGAERIAPSVAMARLKAAVPAVREMTPGLASPRLRGRGYIEALEHARVGWALSRWADQPLYASDRMAHMLGSACLSCSTAARALRPCTLRTPSAFTTTWTRRRPTCAPGWPTTACAARSAAAAGRARGSCLRSAGCSTTCCASFSTTAGRAMSSGPTAAGPDRRHETEASPS